jgi:chaperonin cofactor prefoldin
MNALNGATTTCKQGLNVDPGNKQLEKLLRQAKARIATQKKMNATQTSAEPMAVSGIGADSSISKELQDLQTQYRKSASDYNLVKTSLQHSTKSIQVNKITLPELETIPVDENRKMYSGLGKAFLMQTKDQVFDGLKGEVKDAEKKMEDMVQKKEYLERRMKSQKQNIIECANAK